MRIFISILILAVFGSATFAAERRTPVVQAVQKAGPAVVNIRTEQVVKGGSSIFGFGDPFFEQFFRDLAPPRFFTTQSLGSGVIVDPRGYVLTNAHVIAKASKIFLALPGRKKEIEAKLVGADERLDLAVLRIEGGGTYPHLPLAGSADLLLGETVIAIGNPLGLGNSITTGVVSAPSRRFSLAEGVVSTFIQTDALINPGNSGGPLININGELIGINTAIIKQAQGIGFSIPSDVARRVLKDLIEFGRVRQPFLGVVPGAVARALARTRGEGGVLVNEVEAGSPAAAAGIRVADVILDVDNIAVESPVEFMNLLATYPPGNRIGVRLLRGTQEMTVAVRLAAVPAGYAQKYAEKTFGLKVGAGSKSAKITAVSPGSPAEQVGLRRGDEIAEIEGERIAGVEEYNRALERRLGQLPLKFLVVRDGRGYYVSLP